MQTLKKTADTCMYCSILDRLVIVLIQVSCYRLGFSEHSSVGKVLRYHLHSLLRFRTQGTCNTGSDFRKMTVHYFCQIVICITSVF